MSTLKGVWVFNEVVKDLPPPSQSVSFTMEGVQFANVGGDGTGIYCLDAEGEPHCVYDRDVGWNYGRTVDFGETEQTVDNDFYVWFTANAKLRIAAYVIGTETLEDIGKAIREKLNTTDKYTPTEMPQAIRDISGGGGDDDGSYDQGYADGQTAESDRFWDAYQQNGDIVTYQAAFAGRRWNDESYNPKHPIRCTGSYGAYQLFMSNNSITDTKVPIELNGCRFDNTFNGASNLVTIRRLKLVNVSVISAAFSGCSKLENLTMDDEGSIDVNFNIAATAVLSDASVQSIIDNLKDLTKQTKQILTFHNTVGSKLTAEQKAAITAKNWELVY